jgi:phage FluMu protein gp41
MLLHASRSLFDHDLLRRQMVQAVGTSLSGVIAPKSLRSVTDCRASPM